MTAPTQPPDPQLVTQLARAIQTSTSSGFAGGAMIAEAIDALITERLRVLVEELGGREGPVMPVHSEYVRHERRLFDALVKHAPVVQMSDDLVGDVVKTLEVLAESLNACRAQQRENAETIKALTERAEVAERATAELDAQRKSAEQSARDLRENNATLRAELDAINTKTEHDQALMDTQAKLIVDLETELDAIKGAQVPYRWTVVVKDRMSFTFTSLGSAQTWANGEGGEVIPLYRHPAPTLPVVGACVVRKDGRVIEWSSTYEDADGAARNALHYVRSTGDGTAHQLLLGAPLTPNADGAK